MKAASVAFVLSGGYPTVSSPGLFAFAAEMMLFPSTRRATSIDNMMWKGRMSTKRFGSICALAMLAMMAALQAHASQLCENVVIGMQPAGNGVAETPIYQEQCRWVAGAVVVDLRTRLFSSSWNYENPQQALDSAVGTCGAQCVGLSFYEDFAYIAIAEDDRTYATSTSSANDAISQCGSAGGSGCEAVIAASSTAAAVYWPYGALAYDVATGKSGISSGHARRADAAATAKTACGSETCWAYVFQTGYGAIAKSKDGQLFGAWSESPRGLIGSASKEAKKACKKATGDKDCEIVVKGGAR